MTALTRRSVVVGLAIAGSGARAADQLPKLTVTKDPTCGCCAGWAEHVRAAGFPVAVVESAELNRVKVRLGVPQELASCHTGEIGGYVIEPTKHPHDVAVKNWSAAVEGDRSDCA